MILAELEVWHSRPIAPTRRVALGARDLPCEPSPGHGGLLLAGIVAEAGRALDPDLHPDLLRLTLQLEDGRRIAQPRLRHRFQEDRVGLTRTRHVLRGSADGDLHFDIALDAGTPEQQVLGAVYAAGALRPGSRPAVMRAIRTAMTWTGPLGAGFVQRVSGLGPAADLGAFAYRDPVAWALGVLELAPANGSNGGGVASANGSGGEAAAPKGPPPRTVVQRQFRRLLRDAHPDHGGDEVGAARRIAELTEARRILLGA